MAYFLTTNQNGNITAIYRDDEGYLKPPADAILITDTEGELLASGNFSRFIYLNGIVQSLVNAQEQQLALMDTSYASAVYAPIAYMGTTFKADQSSQSLIAAVLTACGGSLPTGFTWYDINNVAVQVTFAQLQGLAGSILMRGQPLFIHCQTQKTAIRSATDVPTVQGVV